MGRPLREGAAVLLLFQNSSKPHYPEHTVRTMYHFFPMYQKRKNLLQISTSICRFAPIFAPFNPKNVTHKNTFSYIKTPI